MAYFYLNDKKEPQGPHTEEELRDMMRAGALTEETLAAATGDSHWRPLKDLLGNREDMPPVPNPELKCPTCHGEFGLEGNELPVSCPHCQRAFRPKKKGLWANFWLAMRQYAKFSGRATRAEYWSYTLCLYIVYIVLIVLVALLAAVMVWCKVGDTVAGIVFIGFVLVIIATIIPTFAVMVRRLHDVGFSGKWILLTWVVSIASTSLLLGSIVSMARQEIDQEMEEITLMEQENAATDDIGWPIAPLPYREAQIDDDEDEEICETDSTFQSVWGVFKNEFRKSYDEQIEVRAQLRESPMGAIGLILDVFGRLLGIFLFVLTLLDSKRGSNKYGPSRKYPLG